MAASAVGRSAAEYGVVESVNLASRQLLDSVILKPPSWATFYNRWDTIIATSGRRSGNVSKIDVQCVA